MKDLKHTRKALLASVATLTLSFSMLLGTTFAWFTDSAASGSNVITAGNLDVEVQYTLGDDANGDGEFDWYDLDGATNLFQKGLWEPGHTEVVALKIENKGSLALKYAANMNIVSETVGKNKDDADIKLSDILTVSTLAIQADTKEEDTLVDWVASTALNMAFESDDTSLAYGTPVAFSAGNVLHKDQELMPGDSHYVFVKVDMAESVGNGANHNGKDIPTIDFGVNVLATQFTYEDDSFGKDYDEDASTDDVKIEKTVNIDAAGSSDVVTSDEGESVTVKGNSSTLTVSGAAIETNGGDINVEDLTVKAGTPTDYAAIIRDGNATLKNVNTESAGGGIAVADGAEVDFTGNVDVSTTSTSGRYNFYVVDEGSKLTINSGEFSFSKTLNQKRAYIYVGTGATVYVKGGTFGPASTRSGYTAGILGEGTVIITGGTFGFDPSNWVAAGYVAVKSGNTWTVSVAE